MYMVLLINHKCLRDCTFYLLLFALLLIRFYIIAISGLGGLRVPYILIANVVGDDKYDNAERLFLPCQLIYFCHSW